ncbi:MAG: ATP-dependent DNA helicase RecG [Planctomycetales bacterium]|nr:ATP-dependent DNA helicase RecG [Planctomycetales bacterium]
MPRKVDLPVCLGFSETAYNTLRTRLQEFHGSTPPSAQAYFLNSQLKETELTPRLTAPIESMPTLGAELANQLHKMGVHRTVDLLFLFPRDYEELPPINYGTQFEEDSRISVLGTIREIDERVSQSGTHILGVLLDTHQGVAIRLIWFNQRFRKSQLFLGKQIVASGNIKSTGLNWEIVQPQTSFVDSDTTPNEECPKPIYPLTEGLKQAVMRRFMARMLPPLIGQIEEVLPSSLRDCLQVMPIHEALTAIHLPKSMDEVRQAQRRFKIQELLVLQLAITLQRRRRERESQALVCEASAKIHARILNRLPYQLTADQLQAVAEISHDMSTPLPMNRLLQGDVGSGKTLVAQYAMLLCVAHGYQAALMAPTEVLAHQHAATFTKSLSSSRVRVGKLTGSLAKKERTLLLEQLAAGEIDLIIGTHALLANDIQFAKLALVIVDEQHKFGVQQRAQLRIGTYQPHYLVLSATPIPRTIAMTIFGDLDVSTIRQKPPGRSALHTYITTTDQLPAWWSFVNKQLEAGRQAYVITPRISSGQNEDTFSAEQVANQLQSGPFAQRRVGLLHGRLSADAKEETLTLFASGEIDILVSTTVVEVGIDVANATVMTILDAERLGLSQLHQLRGRVSRGTHPGFVCAVASTDCNPQENERLLAFESSDDGFALAERDLQLRGPGDLLGTNQSGLPPLRVANLATDGDLVVLARDTAQQLLVEDPELEKAEYSGIKRQTLARYGKCLQLVDVG